MNKFLFVTLALVASCDRLLAQGPNFVVDTSEAPDLSEFAHEMKEMLSERYPSTDQFMRTPDYVEPETISLTFTNRLQGVHAYTVPSSGKILANADYYRASGAVENGSLYHELVHVVQQYKPNCPRWFSEGFADYMLYELYGRDQAPTKPMQWAGQHYSQGYGPASYFIKWVSDFGHDMRIHEACRSGSYSDALFTQLYGKTKDQLWEEMIYSNPGSPFDIDLQNVPTGLGGYARELRRVMVEVYPKMREFLDSPTYEPLDVIKVEFVEDPSSRSMASARLKHIKIAENDVNNEVNDMFAFTLHGMAHIIQQYAVEDNDWLASGIARLTVIKSYPAAARYLVKPQSGSHYTQGDVVAAYFFDWLDRKYRPHGKRVSSLINQKKREGTYTEREWRMMTGKTVEQLWERMVKEENI